MPVLTKEESERLEGEIKDHVCYKCKHMKSRAYCNRCDEFYYNCMCESGCQNADTHESY